jgi:putative endonuclease
MNTKDVGMLGENICSRFLEHRGYCILARNYRKKWGELDIVAFKDGIVHFCEVKSTTLSRGMGVRDMHMPEENVHRSKLAALRRTAQTFLLETGRRTDAPFEFHVFSVYIDVKRRVSRVRWIKNVVL